MMPSTRALAGTLDATAPDGSEVRLLVTTGRGSMAHFRLLPGAVSKAVAHSTVEEVWYVVAGTGRLWRRLDEHEDIAGLAPGVSAAIPTGAHFQFRNDGTQPLDIVAVTMPPWPGLGEAYPVAGLWPSTL